MSEPVCQVCAVIVAYHPDAAMLQRLLAVLEGQVGAAVVVDNTGHDVDEAHAGGIAGAAEVLRPARNLGLAAAQNMGIDWARQHGYVHVLMLDQDSLPDAGMVTGLLRALHALQADHGVAAVGPRFHDVHEDRDAPFVRIGFPFNRKIRCRDDARTVAADFLISSGSLIPVAVLDDIGGMDAGLFIDSVDLEWSFRARAAGYTLHGVCAARMQHTLGDARRPLPLLPRGIVIHGAERLYYMTRNRVLLYHRAQTPRLWVAQDVPRLLVKFILFGVVVGPRLRHLRFMLHGLRDGMRGRTGPCRIAR